MTSVIAFVALSRLVAAVLAVGLLAPTPERPVPGATVGEPQARERDALDSTRTNSIGMTFVRLAPGRFLMGSSSGFYSERPAHRVTLSRPFELGQHEVTQAQWSEIMGSNPSTHVGPDLPVHNVSWPDAREFVRRLNEREGTNVYRLPTEAEWEYACRAGTRTDYSTGDDPAGLPAVAWYRTSAEVWGPAPVGTRLPNAWGLYDMHGNVTEWVADWYASAYPGGEPVTDPRGPAAGTYRAARGGSWIDTWPFPLRSAFRHALRPDVGFNDTVGFRVAAAVPGLWLNAPGGGETVFAGDTLAVRWEAYGLGGDVEVSLLQGGRAVRQLAIRPSTDTLFAWAIDVPPMPDYRIRVRLRSDLLQRAISEPFAIVEPGPAVARAAGGEAEHHSHETPVSLTLDRAAPNPFRDATSIRVGLPAPAAVWMTVYDAQGRRVRDLLTGEVLPPGWHTIPFDARTLAGGLYQYRLRAGTEVRTGTMLLVR